MLGDLGRWHSMKPTSLLALAFYRSCHSVTRQCSGSLGASSYSSTAPSGQGSRMRDGCAGGRWWHGFSLAPLSDITDSTDITDITDINQICSVYSGLIPNLCYLCCAGTLFNSSFCPCSCSSQDGTQPIRRRLTGKQADLSRAFSAWWNSRPALSRQIWRKKGLKKEMKRYGQFQAHFCGMCWLC